MSIEQLITAGYYTITLEFFDKSQIIPDNIYYQEDDPEVRERDKISQGLFLRAYSEGKDP